MANDLSSRAWFIDTPGAGVIYPYQEFIKFIEVVGGTVVSATTGSVMADIRDRNNKSIVLAKWQTGNSVTPTAPNTGEIQTYNIENWFEGLIVPTLDTANGVTLRVHVK